MALRTPPSWLQNGSHPAENDRLTTRAIYNSTGIIGATSLAVTAQAVPNMTVNVASGWCAIVGTPSNSGTYVAYNDGTTVLTITTADPSLPRVDRIVVTVNDSFYSGATNNVTFQVLAGTPAASPSAPATPNNSISLATIAVAALATSVVAGNITDTRSLTTTNLPVLPITGGTLTGSLTTPGLTSTSNVAVNNSTAANVPLVVTGASGQLTALQQWRNNTPTVLTYIDQNGTFYPLTGTTSAPPIDLRSGSLLNSGTIGGAIEYDGNVAYLAPNSTSTLTTNGGRGLLPSRHFYALSATRTLTAGSTTAQSLFGVGLSLAASTTYEIEIVGQATFVTNTAVANSISVITSYTNLPTSTNPFVVGGVDNGTTSSKFLSGLPLTGLIYTTPATASTYNVNFRVTGLVRTAASTTVLTPQIILSVNNTTSFTVTNNSFVKITPVGTSAMNSIGAWA